MVFACSCNGQSKAKMQNTVNQSPKGVIGYPKMRKTQGSDQYQNVHCGLQDKAGNLWFGTTGEGVYRYDGKLFKQFTVKDGLSSNAVWSILEDTKGNIWFGTADGVCRFDGRAINYIPLTPAGSIGLPANNSSNDQSVKKAVWSIMQDKSGTIWFGADEGLYCYDGKSFTRFLDRPGITNKSSLTLKSIQCMLEDSKGNIWFGSGPMAFEGIAKYDGKTVENFRPQNENWIRNIIEEKDGNLLFATRHFGVFRYDGKAFVHTAQLHGMVNGSMMACLQDRSGNTWFASDYGTELNDTFGGAWRYDGRSYTKYSTKEGLANNSVFLILEDRDGNIWLGTRNIGLYRFNGRGFDSFSV